MPRHGGRPQYAFVKPPKGSSNRILTIGGVRGLAISIDASEVPQLANQLSHFKNTFQRRMMTTALTKAMRPMRNSMAKMTKEYSRGSRRHEGIGATSRSIILKVQTRKTNPAEAYGLIGVRTDHIELITLADPNRRSSVRNVTRGRRKGRGRKARMTFKSLKNIGPIARKARINPSRMNVGRHKRLGSSVRRKPSKYFHLIDSGSKHIKRIGRFRERTMALWNRSHFLGHLQAEVNKHWGTRKGFRKKAA